MVRQKLGSLLLIAGLIVGGTRPGAAQGTQVDPSKHQRDFKRVTAQVTLPANTPPAQVADAARKEARKQAVDQVVGTFLSADIRKQNAEVINNDILAKVEDLDLTKVINTGDPILKDNKLVVDVVVDVDQTKIMKILQQRGIAREWRVMVIVPEKFLQRPIPDPAAETELIKHFIQAGFKVIDQKRYAELRQDASLRISDPKVAAEIGRKFGADVVLTGEAFSQQQDGNFGLASCAARVELRAILVDTAEIIAADATTSPATGTTVEIAAKESLQKAAGKLAPFFVKDVLLQPSSTTRKIQLEVSGFKKFTTAAKFERAVAALKGITRANRESFDAGVLVIEVEFTRESADALAEALEEDEGIKPFNLAVQNVSKTRVIAKVVDN